MSDKTEMVKQEKNGFWKRFVSVDNSINENVIFALVLGGVMIVGLFIDSVSIDKFNTLAALIGALLGIGTVRAVGVAVANRGQYDGEGK